MKTIYLCGPINGCDDDTTHAWRERVKSSLAGRFAFCDPTARDYRGREAGNEVEIVAGDKSDIRDCAMVLAMATRPSWGTAMEILYAHTVAARRVVAVVGDGPVSPWLVFHAHERFRTLGEAVVYLEGLA